ncbi:MAG: hypothetical protein EA365_12340 [Gloeocapsa sp. DLM2.Bin57]|nr:MAG: hypothetical protein EA365_12340 [Gloeocapsa sp. DLM2.Bin57]
MLKTSFVVALLLTILPNQLILAQSVDTPSPPVLLTPEEDNLSFTEAVSAEINRARTNPAGYADWLESLKPYFEDNLLQLPDTEGVTIQEGVATLEEAIVFLRSQTPLTAINSTESLNSVAQRILRNPTRVSTYQSSSSEASTASLLVLKLILDDGDPNRPNRQRLFQPDLANNGIACQPEEDVNLCVIAFEQTSQTPVTTIQPDPSTQLEVILEVEGALQATSQKLSSDNSLYELHPLEGTQGQSWTISLESDDFDTYLAIMDSENNILAQNDDIDENNTNSRLTITLTEDGMYYIIVNSYDPLGRGSYRLVVETDKK